MNYIGQTICGGAALSTLSSLANLVKPLKGDVVEVGVYRGGSALRLSSILTEDKIYLFDTFEGLPDTNEFDNFHKKGDFNDTSYEGVVQLFADNKNVFVYKGIFPQENSEVLVDKKFKLVHLDVDTYTSYKECLAFFHDKIVSGGIMVFDDYNARTCLGSKKAIDEYVYQYGLVLQFGGDDQAYLKY